jgi:hypothetical protein
VLPKVEAGVGPLSPVAPLRGALAVEAIGDARQALFERSLQTLVGKSLSGQVLARLDDGSFVVRVNGTSARMLLPAGAQPGGEVPLTLVSLTPRPTFQVAAFAGSGAAMMSEADAGDAALAASLGSGQGGEAGQAAGAGKAANAAILRANAGMLPAENLPALEADGRQAVLSPGAKVITSVLATALATPDAPTAAQGNTSILARAPTQADTAAVAAELKQALEKSGLFYESHLRDWSEGKRPLADLAREPQMQKVLDGVANRPGAPIDGPTAQFINLQLTSHEQQRLAWQGQLLPGQPMQWEISKDAPERQAPGAPEPPVAWRSAVRFRFPHLGEVTAQLVLVGEQLHLQVRAPDPSSAAALQAHAPRLSDALAAAGSPLSSLNIAPGTTPHD